jgi:hypothetical protein
MPPAIHIYPFHAIALHCVVNAPDVEEIHVEPSVEYTIVVVPIPPATHMAPFQAIQLH